MSTRRELEAMADRIEAVCASHRIAARVTGGDVAEYGVLFRVVRYSGLSFAKLQTRLADELPLGLGVASVQMSCTSQDAMEVRVYKQLEAQR